MAAQATFRQRLTGAAKNHGQSPAVFSWRRLLVISGAASVTTAVSLMVIQALLEESPGPCATDACRRDRDRLSAIVDARTTPCDDFYGFVCNGATWSREGGSIIREVELANLGRLNESLVAHAVSKNSSTFGKLAAFYASCYNAYIVEHDLHATVHAFLQSLNVSVEAWLQRIALEDFLDQIAYLSLHRSIPSFLWLRTEPSGLLFMEPALPLSKRLNVPVYNHIQQLLGNFVGLFDEVAKQEKYAFELHVVNVRLAAVHITKECLVIRVRQALSFLSASSMSVWLSAINKYLPSKSQLSPDSLIAVRNLELLGNLTRTLQASHRVVRNLYVLMTLLETVAEWEYTRYRVIGFNGAAFKVVQYCAAASRLLMTKLWTTFVVRTLVSREHDTRSIRDVVSAVMTRFKDDFGVVTWQSCPYLSIPDMTGSYFLNIGHLRLLMSSDVADDGEHYATEESVVAYNFNRNTLTVTAGSLVKPLYYSGAELHINLASLGALLAYQLWDAVVRHKTWAETSPDAVLWTLKDEAACYVEAYRNISNTDVTPDAFLERESYSRVKALKTILGASSESLDTRIRPLPGTTPVMRRLFPAHRAHRHPPSPMPSPHAPWAHRRGSPRQADRQRIADTHSPWSSRVLPVSASTCLGHSTFPYVSDCNRVRPTVRVWARNSNRESSSATKSTIAQAIGSLNIALQALRVAPAHEDVREVVILQTPTESAAARFIAKALTAMSKV
ncbi:hypothetical protein HPB48_001547 [Haemaphysalis longicornis]|uniref:Peptidase M13 N-terminal domain-containing protein n=1 Tax=Haemaphysalis longicornis TaxID=44386 RepID=A0A9J6FE64_HAELO|nr:hypothetical protein HPB48_001547 [Haemaphysalis longicornis]